MSPKFSTCYSENYTEFKISNHLWVYWAIISQVEKFTGTCQKTSSEEVIYVVRSKWNRYPNWVEQSNVSVVRRRSLMPNKEAQPAFLENSQRTPLGRVARTRIATHHTYLTHKRIPRTHARDCESNFGFSFCVYQSCLELISACLPHFKT